MPKISVIMPVYNGEKYLDEAIKSILNQSELDFEFIIVDDGSTDATKNIIDQNPDNRIKYLKTNHGGIVNALNFGIRESSGVYIARMDADDISLPDRFKSQIEYLDSNSDVAICGTFAEVINEEGLAIGEMTFKEGSVTLSDLFFHNSFIHPSVMIRKKVLDSVGLYKEKFRHVEDYELWSRVLRSFKGVNIPEKLLRYRRHSSQVTTSKKFKMRFLGLAVRVLVLLRMAY